MKQKQAIKIAASTTEIWPFLAVPARMAAWNPKFVSVNRDSEDPVVLGDRFATVYAMAGEKKTSEVEVTACDTGALVAYRHHFVARDGRPAFADESYALNECDGMTKVEQVVDLAGAGIPLVWRLVIQFISRFGREVEEPYLARLKRAVETNNQRQDF